MHIRKYLTYTLPLGAAVLFFGQFAQAVDFKFSGEIRPRVEYANNALNAGTNTSTDPSITHTFTTMRTRLGVEAIVDNDTSGFIQIQDVRTMGGEAPTTAPPSITRTGTSVGASGLDMHQAYIDLKHVLDTDLHLKLGRQEMVFDEHRLIGNIGWIQQGQTFDAARSDIKLTDNLNLTAFIAKTLAVDTHPTLADTASGTSSFDSSFAGVRLNYGLGGKDRITPYFYYSLNPARTTAGTTTTTPFAEDIEYVGAYFLKHFDRFRVRLDGAYEFGKTSSTVNIRAYMLTAAVGTNVDIASGANITLWLDYLSGDNNTGDTKTSNFTTPYATNHAYYGHMDNYLNNPTQGLIDAAIKFWVKPTEKVKFVVHAHWFRSAKSTTTNTSKDLGQEIDTQLHYPLAKNTKLVLGYSHYFKGDVLSQSSGKNHRDGNWAFAMVDFKF